MNDRCDARVFADWHSYQCSRKGIHHENGKKYCGTHLPSRVVARQEKKRKKWDKEWDAKKAVWAQEKKDQKWGEIGPKLLKVCKSALDEHERFDEGSSDLAKELRTIIDKAEVI